MNARPREMQSLALLCFESLLLRWWAMVWVVGHGVSVVMGVIVVAGVVIVWCCGCVLALARWLLLLFAGASHAVIVGVL